MKTKLVSSGKGLNTLCIWNTIYTIASRKIDIEMQAYKEDEKEKKEALKKWKKFGPHNLCKACVCYFL